MTEWIGSHLLHNKDLEDYNGTTGTFCLKVLIVAFQQQDMLQRSETTLNVISEGL